MNRTACKGILCAVAVTAFALAAAPAPAQIEGLPDVSPEAMVSQNIGITMVTVHYHRPGVKGREIFGGLVPYGQVWRAGANENTTVTFSDPVTVEGHELPAGTYGLHTIPAEGDWTVIFSKDYRSWGSFFYDEARDALRVTVTPREGPFEEWLRYGFSDLALDAAVLELHWAGLVVPVKIEVDTHAIVLDKLRNDLKNYPGFFWWGYRDAANYCLQHDINHEEALGWIDQSIRRQENANNLSVKSGLLRQLDRTAEAEAVLARALEIASEAEVNVMGYRYLQSGETDRAIEIFKKNVADHPDSWNTYDSLGEAYRTAGQIDKAKEMYGKAREMTEDEAQKTRIDAILKAMESE